MTSGVDTAPPLRDNACNRMVVAPMQRVVKLVRAFVRNENTGIGRSLLAGKVPTWPLTNLICQLALMLMLGKLACRRDSDANSGACVVPNPNSTYNEGHKRRSMKGSSKNKANVEARGVFIDNIGNDGMDSGQDSTVGLANKLSSGAVNRVEADPLSTMLLLRSAAAAAPGESPVLLNGVRVATADGAALAEQLARAQRLGVLSNQTTVTWSSDGFALQVRCDGGALLLPTLPVILANLRRHLEHAPLQRVALRSRAHLGMQPRGDG